MLPGNAGEDADARAATIMQPAGLPQNVNSQHHQRSDAARSADEIVKWQDGYAWLAGGTWLFSEPADRHRHAHRSRVAQLALARGVGDGLEIAATCTGRGARPVRSRRRTGSRRRCFAHCCRAFLASFKIWNEATVGGNICMSLPAGPMISLTAALEGRCTLWPRERSRGEVAASISSPAITRTSSQPGELLRNILLPRARPAQALRLPTVLAHASRAIGGVAHRHAVRRRWRIPAHHHRRHAAAGAAPLRRHAGRGGAAPRHRRRRSR